MVGPSNLSDGTNTPVVLALPFGVGDTVYLKCGSCQMSVYGMDEKYAYCIWQNYETKEIIRDSFPHAVLRKRT